MKKLHIVSFLTIIAALLLTSCGHNFSMFGVGTGFGISQHGMSYGDGLLGTFVTKDGAKFRAELDSTTGFSYDPSSNTYKGIKSLEYSLPPQVTGYTVKFAKENPEVAKAYYDALLKYYEAEKGAKAQAPLVSDEKSKDATSSISDVVKTVLRRAGNGAETVSEPFTCSGNCELTGLAKNDAISYQTAVATKLLSYADDTTKFEGEETTLKHSLESFIARMEKLLAKGKTTTQLRIKAATVKADKLTYIRYIMTEPDGNEFETNCPECVLLEE